MKEVEEEKEEEEEEEEEEEGRIANSFVFHFARTSLHQFCTVYSTLRLALVFIRAYM